MKKIGNKGFVLAETLIVTVFLLIIFGMIYSNFYPLMGEYEARENYDDIDSKYAAYWVKLMLESTDYDYKAYRAEAKSSLRCTGKMIFGCEYHEYQDMCVELLRNLQVVGVGPLGQVSNGLYITRYQLGNDDKKGEPVFPANNGKEDYYRYFKDYAKTVKITPDGASDDWSGDFRAYVESLPDYKNPSPNGANFRVIVGIQNRGGYNTFGTIEVDK